MKKLGIGTDTMLEESSSYCGYVVANRNWWNFNIESGWGYSSKTNLCNPSFPGIQAALVDDKGKPLTDKEAEGIIDALTFLGLLLHRTIGEIINGTKKCIFLLFWAAISLEMVLCVMQMEIIELRESR